MRYVIPQDFLGAAPEEAPRRPVSMVVRGTQDYTIQVDGDHSPRPLSQLINPNGYSKESNSSLPTAPSSYFSHGPSPSISRKPTVSRDHESGNSDNDSDHASTLKRKLTTTGLKVANVMTTIQENVRTEPVSPTGAKKIDWGLAALYTGVCQAVLCGSIESYILWAIWKYGYLGWGAISGGYQFILVYLALFILAQWFLGLGLFDAAWNKNGMQVLTVVAFNIAIFSYSLIQINQTSKLRQCSDDYIAIFDMAGKPTISQTIDPLTGDYTSLFLASADSSIKFDLLGMCPWSLEPGIADVLRKNRSILAAVRPLQFVIVALTACGNIAGGFFAYKVYQAYGWMVYQTQGASIEKKWMITRYQFFTLLLKYNIFFTTAIVAQFVAAYYYTRKAAADRAISLSIPIPYGPNNTSIILTPSGSGHIIEMKPITQFLLPSVILVFVGAVLYYALGWFGIRRSSYPLMYAFLFIMIGNVFAMSYALYVTFTDDDYTVAKNSMAMFCIVQLILNIATCVIAVYNMRDFKKGLKALLEVKKNIPKDPENGGKLMPRTIPVLD
ncbi:hypothetical protein HDV05_005444 [Chytridiales sp. JEL 0842]|nr:hypothetical protein HDV05_005444 [Chytridiales sp. JEL 0842]